MNIKLLAVAGLLSTTMLSGIAIAEDTANTDKKYYTQLNLGASVSSSSTAKVKVGNTTYTAKGNLPLGLVGLEGGVKLNDNFRVGLGLDYRPGLVTGKVKTNGTKEGTLKFKSFSAMVNAYYDITKINSFTPYITIGAGVAKNETNVSPTNGGLYVAKKTTTNFAYKVGLGSKVAMGNSFDLDLRYQYVDSGKIKFSNTATQNGVSQPVQNIKSFKLRSHEVLVGLAYKF
jgi:opacity protein-like surface antigen